MAEIAISSAEPRDESAGGHGKRLLNRYATVATIATFLVSAITGVMLFFHIGDAYVKGAHEWLSMAFVAAAGFHLLRHSKTFMSLIKAPRTRVAVGVVAVVVALFVTAAALFPNPHERGRHSEAVPTVVQEDASAG